MKTKMTQAVVNGIPMEKLQATVSAIQQDASLAKSLFHVRNRWIEGGYNSTVVQSFWSAGKENPHEQMFELSADEPDLLAGTDKGANPVEHLLNALAACLTTSLVYHAAIRGIHIEELDSEVEGDIDLRGFMGLSQDVRKGYSNIRVKFRIKCDEKDMGRLKELAEFSPVYDVVSHGTNVQVDIELV